MSTLATDTTLLIEAIQGLARGQKEDLNGLVTDVEVYAKIAKTSVVFHLHCLRLDGNGRPRVRDLVRAICYHVLDFAIPRSDINAARAKLDTSGSTAGFVRLHNEAKSLFTDLTQSGEGGELLLFVMAEQFLGLPQLICKMSLKTNTRMHVHGADGIHAGVDAQTKKLILYWGESKIYESSTDAIRECLASLGPMLKGDSSGSTPADRDLQLLQRFVDIDDPDLEEALKRFLDPRCDESASLEFRGLCLVGFDCEHYPSDAGNMQLSGLVEAMKSLLPALKERIGKRIEAEALEPFGIHFICIPFPSAEDFRKRLRSELGLSAGEDSAAS
jgi:hypothetical protein